MEETNKREQENKYQPDGINFKDIAIIGLACRFPGANSAEAFWNNLEQKVCSIKEVPAQRWDWRSHYGDTDRQEHKSNSKWGGFIDEVDLFDAAFFRISPREAELMDPQQRIILELSWACLEDGCYAPSQLRGSSTGVFMGACNYDYKELQEQWNVRTQGYAATGTYITMIANRVSYYFDFHGPSELVDTACSSSLVAIHRAVMALRDKECDLALAGGINLMFTPTSSVSFSQLGMLSGSGRCRTFDEGADGYVRGEGAGVLLLKPLDKALVDRDRIYGVIKASAVNHGGQVRTLTAPNARLQSQLVVQACREAEIKASMVSYIEMHGTGTPLGDPVEVWGLKEAFSQLTGGLPGDLRKKGYCGLGSVKTNIGHLEAAAGVAGVIKVLLAMRNGKLPGTPLLQKVNPRIDINESAFYIVKDTQPWQQLEDGDRGCIARIAGVSSFGFGGANAHVVLQEHHMEDTIASSKERLDEKPYLIVLSAKDENRLKQKASDLCRFIQEQVDEIDLTRIMH